MQVQGISYIDISKWCQQSGKYTNQFQQLKSTQKIIAEIEKQCNICKNDIIIINKNGEHVGVWIHPYLSACFASWLGPELTVRFMQTIFHSAGGDNTTSNNTNTTTNSTTTTTSTNDNHNSLKNNSDKKQQSSSSSSSPKKRKSHDNSIIISEHKDKNHHHHHHQHPATSSSSISSSKNTNTLDRWSGRRTCSGYPRFDVGWILNTEDDLHMKAVDFMRRHCKDLLFIPTLGEMQRDPITRLDAHARGYCKGSADGFLLSPVPGQRILGIEFKNPAGTGIQSDAQRIFEKRCEILDIPYRIFCNYDEFIIFVYNIQKAAEELQTVLKFGGIKLYPGVEFVKGPSGVTHGWSYSDNPSHINKKEIISREFSGILWEGSLTLLLHELQNKQSRKRLCHQISSDSANSTIA